MRYFTTDIDGVTMVDPPSGVRRQILSSVTMAGDADYPEVFLTVPTGPVLSYRRGGVLAWEEDGEVVRILPGITVDQAADAWDLAVDGDLDSLLSLPWTDCD